MKKNISTWLGIVLKNEGGFVNDPDDSGGATNKGITIGTLSSHLRREASIDDVKNISDEQVESIYKKSYWSKVLADKLPTGLDVVVADMAVNAGVSRAAKLLQRAVGAVQDGSIGPNTLKSVEKLVQAHGADALVAKYSKHRANFYNSLNQPKFIKGWLNRVNHTKDEALKLLK